MMIKNTSNTEKTLMPLTTLVRHPASAGCESFSVSAKCSLTDAGLLLLEFHLVGEISSLIIARPSKAIRTDELWRTTCFEIFLRDVESSAYTEINLAPSSAWAIYAFDDYRSGCRTLLESTVKAFNFSKSQNDAKLSAEISIPAFDAAVTSRYRFEPSAILEDSSGKISYWARTHVSKTPDFHKTISL